MKMAIILFDGMTTLDFAGFHNAVTWLKKLGHMDELSWHFCSTKRDIIDDRGMAIAVDRVMPDLSGYDLVFIPGGMATRTLIHDSSFMAWIGTAASVKYKVSVCTGALIFGAAGFLAGRTITTNPNAYELLEPYCGKVERKRTVRDGDLFTGAGITASVDLGLFFVAFIAGRQAAAEIAAHMDYPYYEHNEAI